MYNTNNFFLFLAALICSAVGVPTTPLQGTHDTHDGRIGGGEGRIVGGEGRILGGEDAVPGSAPHMVALTDGSRARYLVCGGSLITIRTVLTAAHCIEAALWLDGLSSTFRGVLGTTDWKDRSALEIRFSDYIIHHHYDRWMVKNDIGVLITEEEIVLNKYVQVIELSFDWVGGGEMAYATGWGQTGPGQTTSQLQLLHVPTTTPQQCVDGMRQISEQLGWWLPAVEPRVEICTLKEVDFGMCYGDSGSALVHQATGRQIGLVSWGLACARGAPDVHVRISAFRDWLTPIMARYS